MALATFAIDPITTTLECGRNLLDHCVNPASVYTEKHVYVFYYGTLKPLAIAANDLDEALDYAVCHNLLQHSIVDAFSENLDEEELQYLYHIDGSAYIDLDSGYLGIVEGTLTHNPFEYLCDRSFEAEPNPMLAIALRDRIATLDVADEEFRTELTPLERSLTEIVFGEPDMADDRSVVVMFDGSPVLLKDEGCYWAFAYAE
jgi:hypothetical protein